MLECGGAGILQQILSGDAHVNGTATHVHRDIQRTQVEQLDAVVFVLDDELTRIGAQTVAGLGQHVPRGF